MNFKLALGMALGITCTAMTAEAKTNWHTYGAVPIAGDPVLTKAYDNALAWCSSEDYRSDYGVTVYGGPYGSPEMRGCLSRKGFIYQSGEPYAYPVRKVSYITK